MQNTYLNDNNTKQTVDQEAVSWMGQVHVQ